MPFPFPIRTVVPFALLLVLGGCSGCNERGGGTQPPGADESTRPAEVLQAEFQSLAGTNPSGPVQLHAGQKVEIRGTLKAAEGTQRPLPTVRFMKTLKDGDRAVANEGIPQLEDLGDGTFEFSITLEAPLGPGEYSAELWTLRSKDGNSSPTVVLEHPVHVVRD